MGDLLKLPRMELIEGYKTDKERLAYHLSMIEEIIFSYYSEEEDIDLDLLCFQHKILYYLMIDYFND